MHYILFLVLMVLLSSCEKIALLATPQKKPIYTNSPLARTAEQTFWDTLHGGHYAGIPTAKKLMTAAYLENPNNPTLAAHLGFLHIWQITERNRHLPIAPTIVDEIILARKYFQDSVDLNPYDPRTQGFLGDSMLVEGQIFHDERQTVRGYFQLKHAIALWPEFNYFTAGYPMSTKDPQSSEFKEGLAWQWKTLDICINGKINRQNPNYAPYMHLETRVGPKRACWNSWIAPHNFEGFFLNMGDMLVKQGDWVLGQRIYRNAMLSSTFNTWPYRDFLKARIQNARQNVHNFRGVSTDPDKTILFHSGFGCMVCHQSK